MLVEQCDELAVYVVLSGVAVAFEWHGLYLVCVDVLHEEDVEHGAYVECLVFVVEGDEVVAYLVVDVEYSLHLLVVELGGEVVERESCAAVCQAYVVEYLAGELGVYHEHEILDACAHILYSDNVFRHDDDGVA